MILIVDDDIAVQTSISLLLKQSGYETSNALNPTEGLKIVLERKPEIIILDLNFGNDTSGKEGLAFLSVLKSKPETVAIPVILITAWASISIAVEGMKKGASDFVSKPWENNILLKTIETTLDINKTIAFKHSVKRAELDRSFDFSAIIGASTELTSVLETISRVCKTDAPVLILGESGTGKELIAEAIHENSKQKNGPFIKVNLGGISSSLFESEMFGHKKGSFTDAYSDRKGRFELADKGTIFLDEIGDLDMNSQVKLLRVLQDKTFQVLGESTTRKIDVRVVCATNRNLKMMVSKGTFREDLLYRINLISLNLPPLRERKGDIPLLVKHFLEIIKETYNTGELSINKSTLKWLESLTFPGNIRELKNLIERTWLMTGKKALDIKDFENALEQTSTVTGTNNLPAAGSMTIEDIEKGMIIKTLQKYPNNLTKVAKLLGLSRGTLYRRLEKHSIRIEGMND